MITKKQFKQICDDVYSGNTYCKCDTCLMSKINGMFICNHCHKPVFNIDDSTMDDIEELDIEPDEDELGNNGEEIRTLEPLQDEETGVIY